MPLHAPVSEGPRTRADGLAERERAREEAFHRRSPVLWAATLFGPFLANGGIIGWMLLHHSPGYVLKLVGVAGATFFFFGRFIILGGQETPAGGFFSRFELYLLVLWIDACVAVVLTYHGGIVYGVPWIGKRLKRAAGDAEFVLARHAWMKRFTFAGLVAFNTVPHVLSGSVFGSILGRVLGLSTRATLVALLCGSIAGNSLMYVGAGVLHRFGLIDRSSPWGLAIGLLVVVAAVMLLDWRFRTLRERWEKASAAQERGSADPVVEPPAA